MKILFVTHMFPYPPDDGGRIGYYNTLKYLSRRHELVLVSLCSKKDEAGLEAMREFCADVVVQEDKGWSASRLARGVAGSPPGTASRYFCRRFGQLLRETIVRHKPDLVELQHANTASYLPFCGNGCPVILREHNVEFKVWERQAEYTNGIVKRLGMRILANRVRSFEADIANRFTRCITVSEADERFLRAVSPGARITTIPLGVDTEYFFPVAAAEKPCSMVITGSFAWKPKQHNLRVLLSDIYPRIRALLPEAKLTVVGKGVTAELLRLAKDQGVEVAGAVPDVRPYLASASLVLNYLESGGGIALKVLEAMAMRRPVLSNDLGVEGIALTAGRDAEVANSKEEFAQAAARLLRDPLSRGRLSENGYRFVQRSYAWSEISRRFDSVYEEILSAKAARSA